LFKRTLGRGFYHLLKTKAKNPTKRSLLVIALVCSSLHGILQARVLEWVAIFLLQGNLLDPGVKPRSPAFQADAKLIHSYLL